MTEASQPVVGWASIPTKPLQMWPSIHPSYALFLQHLKTVFSESLLVWYQRLTAVTHEHMLNFICISALVLPTYSTAALPIKDSFCGRTWGPQRPPPLPQNSKLWKIGHLVGAITLRTYSNQNGSNDYQRSTHARMAVNSSRQSDHMHTYTHHVI